VLVQKLEYVLLIRPNGKAVKRVWTVSENGKGYHSQQRCDVVIQGRSQDFSKGGAEVMEAKALKRKNCL